MQKIKYIAFGALVSMGLATFSFADNFPEKPIKIIVPFKAGGGSDAIAHTFQNAIEVNNPNEPYDFINQ